MSTNTKNKIRTQVGNQRKGRHKKVEKVDEDHEHKIEYTYELRKSNYLQSALNKELVKNNKKTQKRGRKKRSQQMIDQTKKQVNLQDNVKEEEKVYVSDVVQVESSKYGQIFTHFQVGSNQVYFLVNKNETFIEDLRAKPDSVEGNFLLVHYTHALRDYKSAVDQYLQEQLLRMGELKQFLKDKTL